ncbi:MAG: hypothetical protein F4060_08825 [Holophagales bacterium]|nr:hypothetical protein [Holophagales bacterium]MYG29449.1 hypothetical protein [Holophagales bacterium]MYI80033.1 hypothetical protein [Holophagales bacterium]
MSAESQLRPHAAKAGRLLGDLASEVDERMRKAPDGPALRFAGTSDLLEFVSRHLEGVKGAVGEVVKEVHSLDAEILAAPSVADSDLERAVGRLERAFDTLLAGYDDVRRAHADGEDAKGLELLAELYRHPLSSMSGWFAEVAAALADPLSVLRERGLPTTGDVEMPMAFELTAPPELDELTRWYKNRAGGVAGQGQVAEPGCGCLGALVVAVLGWVAVDALVGEGSGANRKDVALADGAVVNYGPVVDRCSVCD